MGNRTKSFDVLKICLFVMCIVVVFVTVTAVAAGRVSDEVLSISAVRRGGETAGIRLEYGWLTEKHAGYSLRLLEEGEQLKDKNGLVEADPALGAYRAELILHNVDVSARLGRRLPFGEVCPLTGEGQTPALRVMHSRSADDVSVRLYIGSDEPLSLTAVENARLTPFPGRVLILLTER